MKAVAIHLILFQQNIRRKMNVLNRSKDEGQADITAIVQPIQIEG
jgi:hypothetical protein